MLEGVKVWGIEDLAILRSWPFWDGSVTLVDGQVTSNPGINRSLWITWEMFCFFLLMILDVVVLYTSDYFANRSRHFPTKRTCRVAIRVVSGSQMGWYPQTYLVHTLSTLSIIFLFESIWYIYIHPLHIDALYIFFYFTFYAPWDAKPPGCQQGN